jgi:hypothetical protein
MSRTNRPDTMLTELRDLKRRIRLLEAARMRPPASGLTASTSRESSIDLRPFVPASAGSDDIAKADHGPPDSSVATPMVPSQVHDWPHTRSGSWERLAAIWVLPGEHTILVTMDVTATRATEGEVRVTMDGQPVSRPWPAISAVERTSLTIQPMTPDGVEIAVEARRTAGRGSVRVAATVRLTDSHE